ncbi:MAG: ABC1 kinase family protein [Campylobacterales bacterium]
MSDSQKPGRNVRIRKTIEELGGTFIKMAQILSTRPDLIPIDLANEFSKLQDNVEPLPFGQIRPRFTEEFGKEVEEIFDGDLELIASASLGQVYRGTLKNGEKVAVKVLKPEAKEIIRLDLKILRRFAAIVENRLYAYGISSPLKIINEFEKALNRELDYTVEALNIKRFGRNFQDNTQLKIPRLYEEFSGNTVLTMELIEGVKVTHIAALKAAGIDPKAVAQNGFELFCEQIFVHRFFHADPHPGNIFAINDTQIALVDFGMTGSISERDRKDFVDMIYYVVKKEEEKAALAILKLAKIEDDGLDREGFAKEMGDVIRTYFYGSLHDISIKNLMNEIIALMGSYRVYFRENNYLLAKTLMTIEGIGKALDPEFNAADAIRPFIMRFYQESMSLSAFSSKVSELPKEIRDFLLEFPEDVKTIVKKMKQGSFKIEFEHVGLEAMESSIEKSANRLSIAIIIASILVGSALLLLAKIPPFVFGIPLLGLVGFFVALIMSFALILSIYRRGRL